MKLLLPMTELIEKHLTLETGNSSGFRARLGACTMTEPLLLARPYSSALRRSDAQPGVSHKTGSPWGP